MRIAFLTHEPFHPPSGGGSAEARYLVEEMVRRGHEVHVFCPAFEEVAALSRELEVHFHLFTRWKMGRYAAFRNFKYLLYPRELERMVRTAIEVKPFDLIVSQHTISAVAAGRLRGAFKVPVVMNFLDFLTGFMEAWPVWLVPRPVLKRLKQFEIALPSRYLADGVLTVSDPLAECFADAGYPLPRIRPIYYGYDSGLFPLRNAVPVKGPPVVIMHGSFDQHHLGAIAREAMIGVHRQRPDVRFKFVGKETPSLQKHLRSLRAAAPDIPLECTGFVPYEQVAGHLQSATLGIVPYEETSGTHCAFVAKAVEYLGVGLPVVSTRLKNLAGYFKNEPRMRFSDFRGADFARQILGWLDDADLTNAAPAAAAARRVQEHLDWTTISRRAVDFMETTRHEFR